MDFKSLNDNQKKFFRTGITRPWKFRMGALCTLKDSMEKHEEEIYKALRNDLGKSQYEAFITEYASVIHNIKITMDNLKKWMKPEYVCPGPALLPGKAYETAEPYGRVLIISPWNYPLSLSFIPLIGAISAGNCCVVKPSEFSPQTSEVITKIIEDCFPPEYIACVEGDEKTGDTLLNEPFDYIFFTGSTNVGKTVMKKAAEHLTPVTLELGGKSPCIVTEDADIKNAARNIAFGKVMNSGQTCIAPDYILADEKIEGKLLKALCEEFNIMVGDALRNNKYPRIINEKHFRRLEGLLKGQEIYCGGKSDPETLKIEPTVLINTDPESPVMQQEIFGPVLPVISYRSLPDAEKFIEDREKPLALYLFTESKETVDEVMGKLSFGGGCVNDTLSHINIDELGFGGVGASGMGSYHGIHSFNTFSHRKGIYEKCGKFNMPAKYQPYPDKPSSLIRKILG